MVDWDISDTALEDLHLAGIRGVRCNIVDLAEAKGVLPISQLSALANKIAPFGWHLEFLMHVNEFPDLAQLLSNFPVPVVLGHLGYLKTNLGIKDRGFQNLLSLMREERAWVKLTGPYRITSEARVPYADTNPFAHALIAANPRQVVWGTDWPHPNIPAPMPNDGDIADAVFQWLPTETLRQQVLVQNPEVLYDFPKFSVSSR